MLQKGSSLNGGELVWIRGGAMLVWVWSVVEGRALEGGAETQVGRNRKEESYLRGRATPDEGRISLEGAGLSWQRKNLERLGHRRRGVVSP